MSDTNTTTDTQIVLKELSDREWVIWDSLTTNQQTVLRCIFEPKVMELTNYTLAERNEAIGRVLSLYRSNSGIRTSILEPDSYWGSRTVLVLTDQYPEDEDLIAAVALIPWRSATRNLAEWTTSPLLLRKLAECAEEETLCKILANPHCPADLLRRVPAERYQWNYGAAAGRNPACPEDVLRWLVTEYHYRQRIAWDLEYIAAARGFVDIAEQCKALSAAPKECPSARWRAAHPEDNE